MGLGEVDSGEQAQNQAEQEAGRAAGAPGEGAGPGPGRGCPGRGPPTTGTWPACRRSPVKQLADQQLENHLWKGAIAALEGEGQPGARPGSRGCV